jgi:iduronate 2-sulfatase
MRKLHLLGMLISFSCLSWAADRPIKNVLFLVSDDLRASALGCYGDTICKTPHIDQLAREGVLFDRAYCQGTVCGPSRTSFMRSRYQGKGNITLGEHLKQHGFYSARVGKIFHMRVPGDIIAGTDGADIEACWTERFNSQGNEAHTPGDYACLNLNIFTDKEEGRQSTKMPHRMFVSVQYAGDGSDQPDHKTATKTIELLQQHKDQPFFIAAGFVRPHYPMVAPDAYFEPYPWQDMVVPEKVKGDLDDMPKLAITSSRSAVNGIAKYPDNQKRMWAAYYAAITFMDEQVGRIMTELDRLGLRESTAVVFISDHGYHLGDHTFWQKANLHEEVIRVPMIVSVPGMKSGCSDSVVELVDLYPTISELVGLAVPKASQGRSLVPVLKDPDTAIKAGAVSFVSKGASWRTRDWAYMRYKDGSEELYDMRKDPGQITNLAGYPEYVSQLKKMAAE